MGLLEKCRRKFPIFHSVVANTSNRLLWGDWDKGEYGVLVRSLGGKRQPHDHQKRHHVPASFLHASIRAPGLIFQRGEESFTLLVGTKFKKNRAMKKLQVNGSVDCRTYYPADGGTEYRGVLEDINATICWPEQSEPCCVNGTCLAEIDSACSGCKVPGAMFGDHFARYSEQQKETYTRLTFYSCWYPKSRHGMEEMVVASNSIWKERRRWWKDSLDLDYNGWTECTATRNIGTTEMVDAIVIPLFIEGPSRPGLCSLWSLNNMVQQSLQLSYDWGYGSLPVLFYREIEGMQESDCERLWEGIACEDGYRKNFFSQEYKFDNGACVHRPPGCEEAYYFPPQDANHRKAGCSAFSEDGAKRIELLCSSERGTPLVIDAGSSMESLEGTKPTTAWRLETSTGNSRAYIFHAAAVVLFLLTRRRRLPREARRGSLSRTNFKRKEMGSTRKKMTFCQSSSI